MGSPPKRSPPCPNETDAYPALERLTQPVGTWSRRDCMSPWAATPQDPRQGANRAVGRCYLLSERVLWEGCSR